MRKDDLVKALQKIDPRWEGNVEVHETATNLYGYHGDVRQDSAEIIIRRKNIGSSSNDIGFKQEADGTWNAIISEYDSRRYNQDWLNKLTQGYTKEVIKDIAHDQGFIFEEHEEDGEIFITCTNSF